jgi:hypothetical protein
LERKLSGVCQKGANKGSDRSPLFAAVVPIRWPQQAEGFAPKAEVIGVIPIVDDVLAAADLLDLLFAKQSAAFSSLF